MEAFSGQRIPYFSNPDLLFDGVPIGMPAGSPGAADNALVMNQTAPTVAAFRGQATLTFPPSVGMLAPLDGQGFRAGTNIILRPMLTDADGKSGSRGLLRGHQFTGLLKRGAVPSLLGQGPNGAIHFVCGGNRQFRCFDDF